MNKHKRVKYFVRTLGSRPHLPINNIATKERISKKS